MLRPQLTESFVAAIAGAPFGLNGFIKIRPLSGETGHLLRLRSVVLRQNGQERTLVVEEAVAQPQAVTQPQTVLFKFAGFDSPEAARALTGAELLVDREHAAPLAEGEFYIEDLKGLEVTALEDGGLIGHIRGIVEGGGGELAEVALASGGVKLVPFRKEFFSKIDIENRRALLQNRWILE
jgi:16S rRNA processing protein RimM